MKTIRVVIAAGLFALTGCGSDQTKVYPVEFQVTVQGKPAVGATVIFHPVGKADPKTPLPMGKVDQSGTVKLSTFAQNDGAPAGEYTITVTWHDVYSTPDQVNAVSPRDKLNGKYSKPDAPSAPRATVEKQPNTLRPLQL